jgi:integrase
MYNIIFSFFDGTEAKMADETIEILPAIYKEMPVVLKTRDGREIKYIRPDEVQNMLSFLEGRDKVFVDLLWNTGARVSEALMVTPGRIDFERSTITITTLKKRKTLPPKGKALRNEIRGLELALEHDASSKIIQRKLDQARKKLSQIKKEPPPPSYRTMPLQPEFAGKLAAYCMERSLSAREAIFPVSRIRAYQIVQSAAEKAGIEKPRRHPHVFRHGFAVNAVTSGVPPLVLRNWMGHADIHSTLIYTEALAEDTKSYLDRMKF